MFFWSTRAVRAVNSAESTVVLRHASQGLNCGTGGPCLYRVWCQILL